MHLSKRKMSASWAATKPQLNFLFWLYFLRSKYEKWGWGDFVSDKYATPCSWTNKVLGWKYDVLWLASPKRDRFFPDAT